MIGLQTKTMDGGIQPGKGLLRLATEYLDSLSGMDSLYHHFWVQCKKLAGEDQKLFNTMMQRYRDQWLKKGD